jgi:pyruvate/2-oxoglutarate dehydrogenase complex dihydrolipoamide dehydrogenase (E3) component
MTSGWRDEGQLSWLAEKGITLVRGTARLKGARRVAVEAADGARHELFAGRAVVLATGTAAAIPPVDGLAESRPWDNRAATAAKWIPARMPVLGGGAVGLELAQAFRRLGSAEVTVVEAADRLLVREEPFAGEQIAAAFAAEGITVVTGVRVTAVKRDGPVVATLADGRQVEADEILVAVGRHAATDHLGLDTVGLTPGRPVPADDRLHALGGWLYAVGDCTGLAPLTHMGKYQARIAADVIRGTDIRDRASRDVVPRVTFTDPQVCAVGLTDAAARERGLPVRAVVHDTGAVAGAYVQGEGIAGTSQLVVDTKRGVVVGATFTGPDTQELLHSATIAVAAEVPLQCLWHAVPSFPTVSEVWLRLLETYGL